MALLIGLGEGEGVHDASSIFGFASPLSECWSPLLQYPFSMLSDKSA